MLINKIPKNHKHYSCVSCDYHTSSKKDYNKHLSTAKHQTAINTTPICPKIPVQHVCGCGKEYKHHSSLWNHQRKCTYTTEKEPANTFMPTPNEPSTAELLTLIKDVMLQAAAKDKLLAEKDKQIAELIPRIGNNNNNTTTNTNTNNNFNVQLFLNNECKDAISIQQFINNIKQSTIDINRLSQNNIVDNHTRIILDELDKLQLTQRPMHCTDLKRNTVHLKNEDEWEKGTSIHPLLMKLSNTVDNACFTTYHRYKASTPVSNELDTPEYNMSAKALMNSCSDNTDNAETLSKHNKVCKNVFPEIKLDKESIV